MATILTTKRFGCFKVTIHDAQRAYVEAATGTIRAFNVDYNVSLHLVWKETWTGKGSERAWQWTVDHFYGNRVGSCLQKASPAASKAIRAEVLEAFTALVTANPELLADANLRSQLADIERQAGKVGQLKEDWSEARAELLDQITLYAQAAKVDPATLLLQYGN